MTALEKPVRYVMSGIRRQLLLCVVAAGAILASGCAGSSAEQPNQRDRHRISTEEIEEFGQGADLYSLVQRVRPMWLVKSGPHTGMGGDDIRVYVNGMRYDTPNALRFYSGMGVEAMRFIEPGPATARFGIGHSHGAIVVTVQGGGYEVP
jgi:hypothetical protein